MAHHILGHKNLVKHLAVVDHKCVANKLRDYSAPSSPGFDWLTRAFIILLVDLDEQLLINKRSFF